MEFFKRVPSIDFMGKRRVTYAISALLMILSFTLLIVRGLNFGIVPPRPALVAYAERIQARPRYKAAKAVDNKLFEDAKK